MVVRGHARPIDVDLVPDLSCAMTSPLCTAREPPRQTRSAHLPRSMACVPSPRLRSWALGAGAGTRRGELLAELGQFGCEGSLAVEPSRSTLVSSSGSVARR